MRYLALATDYDGTLAHHGRVDAATHEALAQLAATGRKLILVTFPQRAEGVDAQTWLFHLRAGDYSQWLVTCMKDETLAQEVRDIERGAAQLGAAESLARIRAAIEQRYTLPEESAGL